MYKRLPKTGKSFIIVVDFERSAAFLGVMRNHAAGYERFVNNGGKVIMKGLIEAINAENMKSELPAFNVGDTVKIGYKIIEGGKERVQNFEGVVIAKKNGGISETFTVRHISYGVGVEKTYPLHSPKIASITVVRKGKVRRAKLYYLRKLTGKAAKVKEKIKNFRKNSEKGSSPKVKGGLLFFQKNRILRKIVGKICLLFPSFRLQ